MEWAFERALNRTPGADERLILRDLYRHSLDRFRAEPESAAELMKVGEAPGTGAAQPETAAMTMVARAILNLHETITRN